MTREVPLEHVAAGLGLADRVDARPHALLPLLPLPALAADVTALDLDDRPSRARDGDDEVRFGLQRALLEALPVEQHDLVRELRAQCRPHRPLRAQRLEEVRFGWD